VRRHTLAHSDAVQVLPYRFVSSSGNALAQLGGEGRARVARLQSRTSLRSKMAG